MSLAVASLALLMAACSGSSATATPAPTSTPSPVPEPVYSEFTEQITVNSRDGVLFDLRLSHAVADTNGNRSLRDELEVLSPDKTEYQGIFPDGDAHLLIVSCFADDCQDSDQEATFTVRYNRVGGE